MIFFTAPKKKKFISFILFQPGSLNEFTHRTKVQEQKSFLLLAWKAVSRFCYIFFELINRTCENFITKYSELIAFPL